MRRVVIAGVSTRAAAESAARAGFAVTAVDAFADLDQNPDVRALSVSRELGLPFSANRAARLATTIDADAIAYLSPFENHGRAIHIMSRERELWGNSLAVLRRVRDPFALADTLRRNGFAVPASLKSGEGLQGPPRGPSRSAPHPTSVSNVCWLVKPRASGGGRGVKPWRSGTAVPRRSILQQRIDGTPGSIVFVAARGRAVPIGFSRQLIGRAEFGASGYRYCGNIMSSANDPQFEREPQLADAARAMIEVVANEFSLIGVNGIDFIARDGVPFPIEVNPRWSSSMELVERAQGFSVFGAHVTACTGEGLPSFDLWGARQRSCATGKAIVFARRDVVIGDTRAWLDQPDLRDVPRLGDRIRAGEPVCTVFAEGPDAASCETALISRAANVYERLERWGDDSQACKPSLSGSRSSALQ
jgi:predicted ATP-grasp superfamily ATP-dependent carboligase